MRSATVAAAALGLSSLASCLWALPNSTAGLGPECTGYIDKLHLGNVDGLAAKMRRCQPNAEKQQKHAPDPRATIPGSSDTTHMDCRYGNPEMVDGSACCGVRPHFNWIVATCEKG